MDDVEERYKRFESYVGAKTTQTLIESFLALSTKTLGMAVNLKDVDALQNELKAVTSSLKSCLLGRGACVAMRVAARPRQRGADYRKHIDFTHPARDVDGYLLDGFDEVPIGKQSSATTEQLESFARKFRYEIFLFTKYIEDVWHPSNTT